MTSANDILARARQRIGIHANEESYEAAEQQSDFNTLVDMLNHWVLDGVVSSFNAPDYATTVTLTFADATTLTSEATLGLSANLAVRLAGSYSVPLPADVVLDANQTLTAILRKQHLAKDVDQSSYDAALSYMPSQRVYNRVR